MKFQIAMLIILSTIIVGCGGQSDGMAPSKHEEVPSSSVITDVSNDSNIKFGETINSSGWEVSIDTTDATEEILLANGWNMEVKYE